MAFDFIPWPAFAAGRFLRQLHVEVREYSGYESTPAEYSAQGAAEPYNSTAAPIGDSNESRINPISVILPAAFKYFPR
jgi:hypothetical protein